MIQNLLERNCHLEEENDRLTREVKELCNKLKAHDSPGSNHSDSTDEGAQAGTATILSVNDRRD